MRTEKIGHLEVSQEIQNAIAADVAPWSLDKYRSSLRGLEKTDSILIIYDEKNIKENTIKVIDDNKYFLGLFSDFFSFLDRSPVKPQQIIRMFLARLPPQTKIGLHKDPIEFSELVRVHWVLSTNNSCQMVFRKEKLHFEVGEIWIFDNMALHGAHNFGQSDRVHLIADLML